MSDVASKFNYATKSSAKAIRSHRETRPSMRRPQSNQKSMVINPCCSEDYWVALTTLLRRRGYLCLMVLHRLWIASSLMLPMCTIKRVEQIGSESSLRPSSSRRAFWISQSRCPCSDGCTLRSQPKFIGRGSNRTFTKAWTSYAIQHEPSNRLPRTCLFRLCMLSVGIC